MHDSQTQTKINGWRANHAVSIVLVSHDSDADVSVVIVLHKESSQIAEPTLSVQH